ncbi:MAG: cyclic nucleotide-binding domain-containing protein [Deltaproteobacteria bacterium]|nr:cyclic nucleotide-binding domain-containing protein [Deltaproteobacteria bacterium]
MLSAGQEISDLFYYLAENDLENMISYFKFKNIAQGETLWKEGEMSDQLAFIVGGKIKITKETEFKGREVVVGVFGKGTLAGELCILDGQPRATSASAMENSTLLLLSKDNFDKILAENPEAGMRLLKSLLLAASTRLRQAINRTAAMF